MTKKIRTDNFKALKFDFRNKLFFLFLAAFAFFQSTPNSANAQYFTGPVASGAGGAGRASVDPLEGALLNPATLSQLNHYYFGVYGSDSVDLKVNRVRDKSLMISDSTPDKLWPMALAYTKRKITTPGQRTIEQTDYYLAIADYVTSRLSLGIGLHRLESEFDGQKINQHNFHIGTLFTPTENFGVALVGYDLVRPGGDVPFDVSLKSTVALGLTYVIMDFVRLRGDWAMPLKDNDENDSQLMLGLESVLHEFFTLRFGAQWDDFNKQTLLTSGFSFTGPKLVVAYAFQKEVQPSEGGIKHLIDLHVTF